MYEKQPIHERPVNTLFSDGVGDALKVQPSVVRVLDEDVHEDMLPSVGVQQGMPRSGGDAYGARSADEVYPCTALRMDPHTVNLSLLENPEIQRGDVGRDGDARVVRSDVQLVGYFRAIGRDPG